MKRRFLRRAGLGLCACFVGIIVLEFVLGGPEAMLTDAGGTKTHQRALAPESSSDPQADVAAILDRPLFETGRHFPVLAAASPPPTEEKAKQIRLMGVVTVASVRLALFQVEGSDKPVMAGPGEQVAGSTVERISHGLVILRGAAGVQSLKPMALTPPPDGGPAGFRANGRAEPDPPS